MSGKILFQIIAAVFRLTLGQFFLGINALQAFNNSLVTSNANIQDLCTSDAKLDDIAEDA